MKLKQLHVVLIAVLISTIGAISQTRPEANLINEFGPMPCGHIHAWTDASAEEIKKDPTSRLAILLYPPTTRPEQARIYRLQISRFLQLRGLDTDRYSFYKSELPETQIRTQFWKLQPGSEQPFADAVRWNEDPPDTSRPFVFGYEDEINICPTFVPRVYARLLRETPGSRGHVVINSGKDAMTDNFSFAEQVMKELVESEGVPRRRLRLFFTKADRNSTFAEFWFVPARKK